MDDLRTVVTTILKRSVLCLRWCRLFERQPEIINSAIGAIVIEGSLSQCNHRRFSLDVHLLARFQRAMSMLCDNNAVNFVK